MRSCSTRLLFLGGCYRIVMHYENHSRSVQAVIVSNFLCEIMNHELCPGLPLQTKQGDKVISHVIPCCIVLKSQQHLPVSTKMFSRDEHTCNLRVIVVVSDGASCNRSFIKSAQVNEQYSRC